MKIRIYALLVMVLSFAYCGDTYAGFVFKKQPATADSSAAIREHGQSFVFSDKATVYQNVKNYVSSQQHMGNAPGNDGSGWEGIVSLVCGILSLCIAFFGATALLLAICAIVFGALGMGRRKRHRGLATAGFVIGVVVLAIVLLAALVILSFLGW